jgi:serine/threonine protein kinase
MRKKPGRSRVSASAATASDERRAVHDVVAGRYRRERTIARGEASEFHEAVHVVTGRRVALRLTHARSGDAHAELARQAAALGAIRHTNVVDIYDAGEMPDGRYFVVLELLEGRSLDAILTTRGVLGPIETAWIGVEVAAGLAAAHARGIAHRDIRPRNIVIVRGQGGGDAVKIVGFANTAAFTDSAGAASDPSIAVPFEGAPAYAAPERLETPGTVDSHADAYALAATLRELLVGAAPSPESEPAIRSELDSRSSPSAAARGLRAVIDRGLARDPAERYPTIRAFLGALAFHAHGPRPSLLPPIGSDVDPFDKELTEDDARADVRPPPLPHARRRSARRPFVAPVTITHGHGTIVGETEDLSEGGMLVLVPRSFPNDIDALVRFVPPGFDHEVAVRATIRWTRTTGLQSAFGAEFIDPPAELTAAIARWVASDPR